MQFSHIGIKLKFVCNSHKWNNSIILAAVM